MKARAFLYVLSALQLPTRADKERQDKWKRVELGGAKTGQGGGMMGVGTLQERVDPTLILC